MTAQCADWLIWRIFSASEAVLVRPRQFLLDMICAVSCALWLLLSAPSAWATPYQESGGQVVMEAENADANVSRNSKTWTLNTTIAGSSGAGYLIALPNNGSGTNAVASAAATSNPELQFQVTFTTTGTYYIWVRGYAASTSDDNLHAGLDGVPSSTTDKFKLTAIGTWNWTRTDNVSANRSVVVSSAGIHTIYVWMYEDGFSLDKIVLTTSSAFTPSGTGPAESPRGGGDVTAPTVSLSAPAAGATISGASVTVSATASDDVGVVGVQFKLDGANLGAEDTTSPYSISWNTTTTTDGAHTLTAVARDAAAHATTSTPVSVTVDNTAPVISALTSSNVTATTATITWTTNEAATSQVDYGTTTSYGQSTPLNATLVTPHSVALSGLSASTLYHYRARSKDAVGTERVSADATLTTAVPSDATPPTGSIVINGQAAATNNPAVTLTLAATDASGAVTQMCFSNTGTACTATPIPYAPSATWTLSSGDGPKTVYVQFADQYINWSAPAAISDTITLDTTPPTISFISPQNGDTLNAPSP